MVKLVGMKSVVTIAITILFLGVFCLVNPSKSYGASVVCDSGASFSMSPDPAILNQAVTFNMNIPNALASGISCSDALGTDSPGLLYCFNSDICADLGQYPFTNPCNSPLTGWNCSQSTHTCSSNVDGSVTISRTISQFPWEGGNYINGIVLRTTGASSQLQRYCSGSFESIDQERINSCAGLSFAVSPSTPILGSPFTITMSGAGNVVSQWVPGVLGNATVVVQDNTGKRTAFLLGQINSSSESVTVEVPGAFFGLNNVNARQEVWLAQGTGHAGTVLCDPHSFTVTDGTSTPPADGVLDDPAFALCLQADDSGQPGQTDRDKCLRCYGSGGGGAEPGQEGLVSDSSAPSALWTAFGCVQTSPTGMIQSFLRIILGLAGGIVLLVILYGAFLLTTSSGDPKRVQEGQEMITSAVMGILFIIFSVIILQFIGVKLLQIPGFGT